MADVNISIYRASVVREGSTPASPGFVVSDGQNPVDPSGSGQNHLPVTITTVATGLSITESQVLGGAGTVGQYIRGDGSLADFPATTGGGSSVSYYLNGSVSQGTIGGVAYKELNRTPIFGAGTDISINADGYIASFITDALDPNKLLIPAGNWNFETYFSASSSGGDPSFYVELYKYNGTTFTLIASSSTAPELIAFGTNLNPYFSTLAVPETVLALTDRLALRYYVTHSGRTITLHTENNHLCQVITTFTTGLTALNGITSQVQYLTVGTSGTDFAISSASDTHTFNLPTASATNRGALSSADWTTFNGKTSNLGTVTSVGLSSATSGVTIGSTPVTTSGTITLAIATASGSQNGLLSSTDWTTFNGKQNALTNPVTGTGTTNYLPKFTGASTIANSQIFDDGTNVGIGTATPTSFGAGYTVASINGSSGGGVLDLMVNTTRVLTLAVDGSLPSISSRVSGFPIVFRTNNGGTVDERFRIFSDGNVLIQSGGTFTNAGFKLDVNGRGRFTAGAGQNGLVVNGVNSIFAQSVTAGTGTSTSFGMTISAGTNSSDIAFQIYNSAENAVRLFVRGDGNVGIGTASPTEILHLNKTSGTGTFIRFQDTAGGGVYIGGRSENMELYAGNAERMRITSAGDLSFKGRSTTSNYEAVFYNDNSQLAINANNTNVGKTINFNVRNDQNAMTITSGGNVGIGTASPLQTSGGRAVLTINGSSSTILNFGISGTLSGYIYSATSVFGFYSQADLYLDAAGANRIISLTNGVERMRITSGGEVLVGTTTTDVNTQGCQLRPFGLGIFVRSGASTLQLNRLTSDGIIASFRTSDVERGSISISGSTTSYNTTSDYRLKEDFKEINGLEKVNAIKVYDYKWKSDNKRMDGVLAHELSEVLPYAVFGQKDELDEYGNNRMQSVDYSKIVPVMVKAIQELKQEIDTLKK